MRRDLATVFFSTNKTADALNRHLPAIATLELFYITVMAVILKEGKTYRNTVK